MLFLRPNSGISCCFKLRMHSQMPSPGEKVPPKGADVECGRQGDRFACCIRPFPDFQASSFHSRPVYALGTLSPGEGILGCSANSFTNRNFSPLLFQIFKYVFLHNFTISVSCNLPKKWITLDFFADIHYNTVVEEYGKILTERRQFYETQNPCTRVHAGCSHRRFRCGRDSKHGYR